MTMATRKDLCAANRLDSRQHSKRKIAIIWRFWRQTKLEAGVDLGMRIAKSISDDLLNLAVTSGIAMPAVFTTSQP